MTPQEVKDYYRSSYNFNKVTGMSCATLNNWIRKGYVPCDAQYKLESWTHGVLKVEKGVKNKTKKKAIKKGAHK